MRHGAFCCAALCRGRSRTSYCPACLAPAGAYTAHLDVKGNNAIALYDVANCWVRNVSERCAEGLAAWLAGWPAGLQARMQHAPSDLPATSRPA